MRSSWFGVCRYAYSSSFCKKGIDIVGFDLNEEKIRLYKSGIVLTKEVGDENIKESTVKINID